MQRCILTIISLQQIIQWDPENCGNIETTFIHFCIWCCSKPTVLPVGWKSTNKIKLFCVHCTIAAALHVYRTSHVKVFELRKLSWTIFFLSWTGAQENWFNFVWVVQLNSCNSINLVQGFLQGVVNLNLILIDM